MLREVFESQGLAVLGKAQKRFEQRHVDIHIFSHSAIVSCWGSRTIDKVLDFIVLRDRCLRKLSCPAMT